MAILSDADLEFAKSHIERFYDSDFFPKHFEFEALWHFWPEVKHELSSKNISKLQALQPRTATIPKARGGFRVVHQLEPIEAICYTAMAHRVATAVESNRPSKQKKVACSYRISIGNGSFFSQGSGWRDFSEKSAQLAAKYKFAATTDITDFYNQIYLHRLQNSIETCASSLAALSKEIESFITAFNDKVSQGVPVGPAASMIFAEALMIDIDSFISQYGVRHTRYVDDIRIFGNSKAKISAALEALTTYLYRSHRLTLAADKTEEMTSEAFVEKFLENQHRTDRDDLKESLDQFSPYGNPENDFEDIEEEEHHLKGALDQILKYEVLDLGLARSLLRTARRYGFSDFAEEVVDNFDFFAPVCPDVFLYLIDVGDADLERSLSSSLLAASKSTAAQSDLPRYWLEHYIARSPVLLRSTPLRRFVMESKNFENIALAAKTSKNLAWVRMNKASISSLGGKARRSLMDSSRVLSTDERTNWLRVVANNAQSPLDKWVANWIRETS